MYRFTICLIIVSWLVALSAEAKQFTHEHHVCKLASGLARMVLGALDRSEKPKYPIPEKWKLEASAKQLDEITDKCREHPEPIEMENEYDPVDVYKREANTGGNDNVAEPFEALKNEFGFIGVTAVEFKAYVCPDGARYAGIAKIRLTPHDFNIEFDDIIPEPEPAHADA